MCFFVCCKYYIVKRLKKKNTLYFFLFFGVYLDSFAFFYVNFDFVILAQSRLATLVPAFFCKQFNFFETLIQRSYFETKASTYPFFRQIRKPARPTQ